MCDNRPGVHLLMWESSHVYLGEAILHFIQQHTGTHLLVYYCYFRGYTKYFCPLVIWSLDVSLPMSHKLIMLQRNVFSCNAQSAPSGHSSIFGSCPMKTFKMYRGPLFNVSRWTAAGEAEDVWGMLCCGLFCGNGPLKLMEATWQIAQSLIGRLR